MAGKKGKPAKGKSKKNKKDEVVKQEINPREMLQEEKQQRANGYLQERKGLQEKYGIIEKPYFIISGDKIVESGTHILMVEDNA